MQNQANKESPIGSVRKLAPRTVAGPVLIGGHDEVTPQQVRDVFRENSCLTVLRLSVGPCGAAGG